MSDEEVFADVFAVSLESTGIIENLLLDEKRHPREAAKAEQIGDEVHASLLTPEIRHLQNTRKSLSQADKRELMHKSSFIIEVANHV